MKCRFSQYRFARKQRFRDLMSELNRPGMVAVIAIPKCDEKARIGYGFHFFEQPFLDAVLVLRHHDAPSRFFLPIFSACVDLAVSPKQESAGDPAGTEESLRGYPQQIAPRAPSAQKLEEIIERSDPDNPTLGVVHHGHEQAYLLASVPDDD